MTKHEGGRYQDEKGLFLPWYTSPCLEWLMTLDLKDKDVFEYGLGDSTKWYMSKGAKVYGVDSDHKWLPENPCGFYVTTLKERYITGWFWEYGPYYDIVVIDGLYRDECTFYALKQLKRGGYLIIDNYMQPSVEMEWSETNELIKEMPITIYKEPDHYDWQTAVIEKP